MIDLRVLRRPDGDVHDSKQSVVCVYALFTITRARIVLIESCFLAVPFFFPPILVIMYFKA